MSRPRPTLSATVSRLSGVHNEDYTYSDIFAKGSSLYLKAYCVKHSHDFFPVLSKHLRGAAKCPKCLRASASWSVESLQVKSDDVHGAGTYIVEAVRAGSGSRLRGDRKAPEADLICRVHGRFTQLVNAHVVGKGCYACGREGLRDSFSQIVEKAKAIHGEAYTYTEVPRKSGLAATIKMNCADHGTTEKTINSLLSGHGCRKCGDILIGLKGRLTAEELFERHGSQTDYKFISAGYSESAAETLVKSLCSIHGEFSQTSFERLRGVSCPKCYVPSKAVEELAGWLISLGHKVERESRKPYGNSGARADLVVNDTLVIEYNGAYWHTSVYVSSSYHKQKYTLATKNGYSFFSCYDFEYRSAKEKIRSMIARRLVPNVHRVFARKTYVKAVDHSTAAAFLDTFHVQGSVASTLYLGCYIEETLVAIAAFGDKDSKRGSRVGEGTAELTRYAASTVVVGGLLKLVQHAKNLLGFHTLKTFSDNRMFSGDLYVKSGFTKLGDLRPDYSYYNPKTQKLEHKANYQKSRMLARGFEGDMTMTEEQIASLNKFFRVYDCGKQAWIMQLAS